MGFGNFLKKTVPFIASALPVGGPLATMAVNIVASKLGIDPAKIKPDVSGVESAIAEAQIKDPDALVKLQQAEQEFELQMKKLGFETAVKLEELDVADRASARAREIAVKDKSPARLAAGVTFGFFGLLALIIFIDIPTNSATVLNVMTGSLGTAWIGIINYYFGSSSGSAKKTEIMAEMKGTGTGG